METPDAHPHLARCRSVSAGTPTVQAQQCPGGVSSKFVITGDVNKPQVFDLDRLTQKYSPAQENVTYFAAGSVVTESFTGVLLWDLLNSAPVGGITTNSNIKNDILHKVIVLTGSKLLSVGVWCW